MFTLSADKAARKLVAFQVADPRTFPVHLIACAVASGASYFQAIEDVGLTSHKFAYRFDGEPFSLEELQLLSLPLSGPKVPKRIKELALVLNAVSTLGRAKFRCYQKDRAIEVSETEGTLSFAEVNNDRKPHHILFFDPKGVPPVSSDWVPICEHAPLNLQYNGEKVDTPLNLITSRTYGRYEVKGGRELRVHCSESNEARLSYHKIEDPDRRSLVLALTSPAEASEIGLQFVADGVSIRAPRSLLGFSFLCGAIEVSDLNRDLSRTGFVEDAAYLEMVKEIKIAVDEFLNHFYRFPAVLKGSDAGDFRRELFNYYGEADTPREALSLMADEGEAAFKGALELQGQMAQESDDWSLIAETQERLRARATLARSEYEASETWQALGYEQTLLEAAGQNHEDLQFLLHLYQSLCIGTVLPDSVSDRLVDAEPPRAERFLVFLGTLSEHTHEQRLSWLTTLQVPSSWAALLLFEMSMQGETQSFDCGYPVTNQILEALIEAEKGSAKSGLSTLWSSEIDNYQPNSRYLWLDFFWRAYRAKLSWPRAIALRADLSLNFGRSNSQTQTKAHESLSELSKTGFHHGTFLHQHIFEPNPLPQLLMRLDTLRKLSPKDAYQFLGHCLIQVMLGESGTPLAIPKTYPENWLFK